MPIKDLNIQNSIMPTRTSKSKIYHKIQVVINIHRQIQFLRHTQYKKKSVISVPIKDFIHQHYMTLPYDTPGLELEPKVNTYLTEMSSFLWENSLLISAQKSSVTLYTPDPAQANTRPKIKIAGSKLPLVRSPNILGVYIDTFFSFNNHCVHVANRVSKRNNILKALAGTN